MATRRRWGPWPAGKRGSQRTGLPGLPTFDQYGFLVGEDAGHLVTVADNFPSGLVPGEKPFRGDAVLDPVDDVQGLHGPARHVNESALVVQRLDGPLHLLEPLPGLPCRRRAGSHRQQAGDDLHAVAQGGGAHLVSLSGCIRSGSELLPPSGARTTILDSALRPPINVAYSLWLM